MMNDVIVYKEVGAEPEVKKIDIKDLKTLQNLVGGYITTVWLPHKILMVCNDEGIILNLPLNFYINGNPFFGNVFFCSYADEDFTGLNEEQLDFLKNNIFEFFEFKGEATC